VSRGGHRGHNVLESLDTRESEADSGYGPICLLLFGVEGIRINSETTVSGTWPYTRCHALCHRKRRNLFEEGQRERRGPQ
jgi:hypothetical protein